MTRRSLLKCGLASLAAAAFPFPAFAYPDRPIRLIVPFSPGGATDVVGRLWADKMKAKFGTIVVENKGGGGGLIGATEVARSAPDGETFLFGNTSTQVLLPVINANPPYSAKDFAAIYILALSPNSIVVHKSVPATTLKELIAYAKANPGKLSYGSAGAGTMTNLAGELFKELIGVSDITHIPYKGAAPGLKDLAGGIIPMMTPNVGGPLLQLHKAGTVRILAVMSKNRLKAAPDIPTTAEAGLPELIAANFNGLFAPAGVPKPIIDQIAGATRVAMTDQALQDTMLKSGFEPVLDSGPEQAQHEISSELTRWTPIIKKIGFTQ